MLVQQAMQQSYARQTGVLPPAAGAQQQAGAGAAGQLAPTTRVKWGVEANDDDFKEVIGQDVREQKQMWQGSLRVQFDGSAPMDGSRQPKSCVIQVVGATSRLGKNVFKPKTPHRYPTHCTLGCNTIVANLTFLKPI